MNNIVNKIVTNSKTIKFIQWIDKSYLRWRVFSFFLTPLVRLIKLNPDDDDYISFAKLYVISLGQL